VDPERMGGSPCIRGTRVTVGAVVGQLATGCTVEQVLEDYPYLDREDVLAPWRTRRRRQRAAEVRAGLVLPAIPYEHATTLCTSDNAVWTTSRLRGLGGRVVGVALVLSRVGGQRRPA
jgi:uncharacterized protein (DUF433 family)